MDPVAQLAEQYLGDTVGGSTPSWILFILKKELNN